MHKSVLVLICVFAGVIGVIGFILGSNRVARESQILTEQITTLDGRVLALEKQVKELGYADIDIIKTLTRESSSFVDRLTEEQRERERASTTLAETLSILSDTVSVQSRVLTTVTEQDAARIVEQWKPYVYQIECMYRPKNKEKMITRGSGIIEFTTNGRRLITNAHVALENELYPDECTIGRFDTDHKMVIDGDNFVIDEEDDIAWIPITDDVAAFGYTQVCVTVPAIGDRVVMLGYPKIGGSESITATEGIISGFDDDYYTSSAKIENGNSGGAAIDVRRNCLLGLPTLVVAGRIESLARILPLK